MRSIEKQQPLREHYGIFNAIIHQLKPKTIHSSNRRSPICKFISQLRKAEER